MKVLAVRHNKATCNFTRHIKATYNNAYHVTRSIAVRFANIGIEPSYHDTPSNNQTSIEARTQ